MEIFKDIKGYKGSYKISNYGRVLSLKKSKTTYLKHTTNSRGYDIVCLHLNGRQKTKVVHKLVAIHFLNHTPNGHTLVVDHIDNNRRNNRADNLQLITARENNSKDQKNRSSKYTGVTWHKGTGKWAAQIKINYRNNHLGLFDKEEDAAKAYKEALKKIN